jgi:putative nucleotidyltransferase with HDIG domain
MTLGHLAKRFVGSLWPGGPSRSGIAFVESVLGPGELALWQRMSRPDQRHSIAVARRLGAADTEVQAAALLHDVGKIEAGVGTFGRVAATVIGPGRARGRLATYLRHDQIGAALLAGAGARPLVITWAGEHHLPPERWTVPPEVGAALKAADDD